jgi:Ca-activated chloride channel family protein
MTATDVSPSRLGAAVASARQFISKVPASIRVGVETFSDRPVLRQSPTTDHTTAADSLAGLSAGGHTAIGDALNLALTSLTKQKNSAGKAVPAAIVLLSDGTSTVGTDPRTVAQTAKSRHIAIDTVAVGTASGTIGNGKTRVPVDPSELQQIAQTSGGRSFTVADAGRLSSVYTSLAHQLSRHRVEHQLTATVAGAGLILLLAGGALSLYWFGRPVP